VLVHNLTDVTTAALTKKGMVKMPIVVGKQLITPGQCLEVADDWLRLARAGLQELVAHGAAAVGPQPPASYVLAKNRTLGLQSK
jgi:hypothetical protein